MAEVGDAEQETDGIQDVAFTRPAEGFQYLYRHRKAKLSTYPFKPVMALNWWSNPLISVLCP